jgi:D-alanine-D-alanine ligase
MSPIRIAFCYNVKHQNVEAVQSELEFDFIETIDGIVKSVESLGHSVVRVEADENAWDNLSKLKSKIDLVFNIAEGLRGDARESYIPQFCEMLNIPYTHSSPTVLAICLDKYLTRMAVRGGGVKVAEAVLVQNGRIGDLEKLKMPVIIKPNGEGSSMGIFDANVVDNPTAVEKRVKELRDKGLKGEILIEEFIDGREFTVGLLGNPPEVLPIIEQKFDFMPPDMKHVAGYELKWMVEDTLKDLTAAYSCPAKLTEAQQKQIEETSKLVYKTLKIRDCARMDYRMDKSGELYFIEVNPIPGINPTPNQISYFPLAARTGGIDFPHLMERIINSARARYGI